MKDVQIALQDILTALQDAVSFLPKEFASFQADRKTQYAIVRAFEIVGEAAKRVPQSFRDANPGIEWRQLAGFRDVLIHQYFRVDWELVWKAATDDAPRLIVQIQTLLRQVSE